MIKPELYNKTVDILVQAYFFGELEYSDCAKCAVGNIVAANMGVKPEQNITDDWGDLIMLGEGKAFDHKSDSAMKQINITGYSLINIANIEFAFYKGCCVNYNYDNKDFLDENNFNGLMAVIDVLDQIHENNDTQLTTETKSKFKKQLA